MKNNLRIKTTLALVLLAATAFHLSAHNGILVSPKMFLKGALNSNGLMRDDLRVLGLLPSTEPYSSLTGFQHYGGGGGETIANPSVFAVTGNDAIVDWVMVEIRSDANLGTPLATRSALLQRDGDVVAMDGVSAIHFLNVAPGQYHVSVRHRNHLGVMTAGNFSLSKETTLVDFSDPGVPLYGTSPASTSGGVRALWAGDINGDKNVIYQGPGNDIFYLFSYVLYAPGNVNVNPNFMALGYSSRDLNLDGYAIFNGPNNDRNLLFLQAGMECGALNCIFKEQLPQ
jgi:hypothetical protein